MSRKIVMVSALFIAWVIPALAQQQQPQQQRRGGALERIQKELDLTADQINSLQTLMESQRQTLQPLTKDVRDKTQALRDLQQQPNPNSTDVGNAMLAMRAARQRLQEAQQNFQQSLRNLLTTEQIEKLDQMKQRGKDSARQPRLQGRKRNR
jgi:Spy/CpxP family protein refolding chaperone